MSTGITFRHIPPSPLSRWRHFWMAPYSIFQYSEDINGATDILQQAGQVFEQINNPSKLGFWLAGRWKRWTTIEIISTYTHHRHSTTKVSSIMSAVVCSYVHTGAVMQCQWYTGILVHFVIKQSVAGLELCTWAIKHFYLHLQQVSKTEDRCVHLCRFYCSDMQFW